MATGVPQNEISGGKNEGRKGVVVVGLPLLFLGMEVWREQQSRFTPST